MIAVVYLPVWLFLATTAALVAAELLPVLRTPGDPAPPLSGQHRNPDQQGENGMSAKGFSHGQRVQHARTGQLGRVKLWNLTAAERAEGCAQGEVRWDDSIVAEELDLVADDLRAVK